MHVDEVTEYQQNEIDGALDAIQGRLDHISTQRGPGLLNGVKLREHQNDRLEAFLEGYCDALNFAASEVENISNLVKYVHPPESVTVLRFEGDPDEGLTFVEAETPDGESVSPEEYGARWEQDDDHWLLRIGIGEGEA